MGASVRTYIQKCLLNYTVHGWRDQPRRYDDAVAAIADWLDIFNETVFQPEGITLDPDFSTLRDAWHTYVRHERAIDRGEQPAGSAPRMAKEDELRYHKMDGVYLAR